MKTALLLCGQMRTFDHPKVLEYMNRLIEKFDCDVFISTWKDRGVSLWSVHSQDKNLYDEVKDQEITEESISIINNIRDCKILDFNDYLNNQCSPHIKNLLISNEWGSGATSNPQFYTMHIASEMKKKYERENGFDYDVVIQSRPDFLQVHNDVEKYFHKLKNTLYHINTGKTYSPNRVYAMFLMSESKIMDIICNSWLEYDKLTQTNYEGVSKYDACRLLYAQCIENGIDIVSFGKVLGDALRLENYPDYQSFENMFLKKNIFLGLKHKIFETFNKLKTRIKNSWKR